MKKTQHFMQRFTLKCMLMLSLLFNSAFALWGQETIPAESQNEQEASESDTIEVINVEATQISEAFTESNSLMLEAGQKHFTPEAISSYTDEVNLLFSDIRLFMRDTMVIEKNGISYRELDLIEQQINFYLEEVKHLQERISDEAGALNTYSNLLSENKQDWEQILETFPSEEIPRDRIGRITRTMERLDSLETLLQGDLAKILKQEDRLTDQVNNLEQLQVWVEGQRELVGERFFTRELPGFFESMSEPVETTLVQKHLSQVEKSFNTDMEIVKANFRKPLGVILIILVSLMIYAFWFKKNHSKVIAEKFTLTRMQKVLVHSPLVTVLFLTGLLIRFSLPHLPHTFASLNLMLMMIPMIIIIIRFFGSKIRNWILLLFLLCGLTFFYQLSYNPDILLRAVLMAFSLWAIALFVWLLVKRPVSGFVAKSFIYGILRAMLLVFIVLLVVAVFANLAGAFSLAEFFTLIPIQIVLLAFGVEVATTIADTVIHLILASNFMQRINIIRDDFEYIYKKLAMVAKLLLWGLFFVITLSIFRIKDAVFEWVNGLFTDGIKVGDAEITIGSIAIFIIVIWISILVSRIIRHVLEKDVFPRVETAKGVPSTVTLLLRIILITSGFFLAAAAAGIKLSNLSIVLGAFSVGIGFGLQNIFNNMVSGLILALERPIKVGDVVQVGDLLGAVRSIGLRSSSVKSFDGAEVIVPNGNLISNEMINWTLSDANRRLDIRVGVAYGTDTDEVIRILQKIAVEHPLVDMNPVPKAYFTAFGDSSLDFRLLAWTHIDQRLAVESDLNGSINKALKKAGIEIPFPQRDLHIRSDSTRKQQ